MTWAEMGVAAAVAGVAVAAWFGIWTMVDRRFAELRGAIERANESNEKAHAELRGAIEGLVVNVNDVKVTLAGVQKDVQYLRRDVDSLRRDVDSLRRDVDSLLLDKEKAAD